MEIVYINGKRYKKNTKEWFLAFLRAAKELRKEQESKKKFWNYLKENWEE